MKNAAGPLPLLPIKKDVLNSGALRGGRRGDGDPHDAWPGGPRGAELPRRLRGESEFLLAKFCQISQNVARFWPKLPEFAGIFAQFCDLT